MIFWSRFSYTRRIFYIFDPILIFHVTIFFKKWIPYNYFLGMAFVQL